MPIELPTNEDESLRPFTPEEVAGFGLKRLGVRDHTHATYTYGPDGSACTRRFACDWDFRHDARVYFVGASKLYTDGGGDLKISRIRPQVDPDHPNWIATKCEVNPWRFTGELDEADATGASEALPVFTRAELRVTYEMVPFEVANDDEVSSEEERYVTRPGMLGADVTTEANYIGLPGSSIQFATATGAGKPAGVPVHYPVGFVEGTSKMSLIWRRVPREAWGPSTTLGQRVLGTEAARGMIGALNKTSFYGYPPLSLQLLGVAPRELPDPTGLGYSLELVYQFTNKPTPFGHLGLYYHDLAEPPAATASGYYQCLRKSGGKTTKAAADIADTDAMFIVREFADLLVVGDV